MVLMAARIGKSDEFAKPVHLFLLFDAFLGLLVSFARTPLALIAVAVHRRRLAVVAPNVRGQVH